MAIACLASTAACSAATPSPPVSQRPRFTASARPAPSPSLRPQGGHLSFADKMRAFAFSDPAHGLLLHQRCRAVGCRTLVEATSDGGTSWQRRGSLPAPRARVSLFVANRRTAVAGFSRHGPDWRHDTAAYVTTDGGAQWQTLALPARSRVAAVTSTEIWAVQDDCPERDSSHCSVGVYSAPVGRRVFDLVSTPRTGRLAVTSFAASGSSSVYLAAGSWYSQGSMVLASADGGESWRVAPNPCSSGRGWGVTLSTPPNSPRTVWALCYAQPAAGTETKELAVSYDAAATWTKRPNPGVGGYGADLVATSPTSAWEYEANRADVLLTTDRGRSWHDTLRGRVGESAGAATYWFDPLSTDDAWVISQDRQGRPLFLRTRDAGATWKRLTLPF